MVSSASPSNCGLRCKHHKNAARRSVFPQVFSISRTIPLDMFAKLSTIRAQSGKKWRRGVESVGQWGPGSKRRTQQQVVANSDSSTFSYRNTTAGANQRVTLMTHTPGGLFEGFHAAGQLSSDGGRERPAENSRRLSGRTAQERHKVLRHLHQGRSRHHLLHESLGRNRKEAREAFFAQRGETKISIAYELLRSSGRGGWLGAHSDSTCTQRIGGNEGGSGRPGQFDLPGSLESQPVPGSNEP